ncbi:hypothetical protein MKX03_003874 [Papaver bracteatum]|nr:hypothetical protein MKX03_003874 [Papaver bracteatum]
MENPKFNGKTLEMKFGKNSLIINLAGLGAKLIISARNEAELERVKSQLVGKHAPEGVKVLPLDLTAGEESLKEIVMKAQSYYNGVDFMIHNAANDAHTKTSALDVTQERLKLSSLTIKFTNLLMGHLVVYLKIVMSSAAGKIPAPSQAVYSASKYALNGYFHTLRSELNQKGIKVTVVCPGPIDTPNGTGSSGKMVSSERCAELTIIAATHGLKEAWISDHPVLTIMYLAQYTPAIGFWITDKIGGDRVLAASAKENTDSWSLLFGQKKIKGA